MPSVRRWEPSHTFRPGIAAITGEPNIKRPEEIDALQEAYREYREKRRRLMTQAGLMHDHKGAENAG